METEISIKKIINRYEECNKKLKLTDLSCKCKKRFCIKHRCQKHIVVNYKDYERNILYFKTIIQMYLNKILKFK